MNYRTHIIIAFTAAMLLTIIGWSQSLVYKVTPLFPLAVWFPLVALTGAHELFAIVVSLIQFPLIAIAYLFGIRRWPWQKILPMLLIVYATLAGLAYAVLKYKLL